MSKKLEELIEAQREHAVQEYLKRNHSKDNLDMAKLPKRLKSALKNIQHDVDSFLLEENNDLTRSVDLEFGNLYTSFADFVNILAYFKNYPPLAEGTALGWLPITDEQKDGKGYNCGYWEDGKWKTGYFHYFNDPFNELSEWLTQDSCDIGIEPSHYFPIDLVEPPFNGVVPVPAVATEMEDKE